MLARVEPADGLVPGDLMVEAVIEDAPVKEQVFRAAARVLPPEAILASSTSSIPITALAAVTERPERVVGMHFFNPARRRPRRHGAFWVAPRDVLDRVGPLDERFEGAFFEDDDFLGRLRQAGVPTKQIPTVRVWSLRIGLTMSKLPDRGQGWLYANERRFAEKWSGARLHLTYGGRRGLSRNISICSTS